MDSISECSEASSDAETNNISIGLSDGKDTKHSSRKEKKMLRKEKSNLRKEKKEKKRLRKEKKRIEMATVEADDVAVADAIEVSGSLLFIVVIFH